MGLELAEQLVWEIAGVISIRPAVATGPDRM